MVVSSKVLIEEIIFLLENKKQTFAIAESCTVGALSASFAYKEGLSKTFLAGLCTYSNAAKEILLGVGNKTLKEFGAVSKEVAAEMASGLKERIKADWVLSVTGTAGPSGGTKDKPVGTVCFAVSGPNFVETYKEAFSGNRKQVQEQAIDFILRIFIQHLKAK